MSGVIVDADTYRLGLRLVQTDGWEWRPGMRAVHPDGSSHRRVEEGAPSSDGFVPDMSDDVTAGAVFFLAKDVLYSKCRPGDWAGLDIRIVVESPYHRSDDCPFKTLGHVSVDGEFRREPPVYWIGWEWCSESSGVENIVEAMEMICGCQDPIFILTSEELRALEEKDDGSGGDE